MGQLYNAALAGNGRTSPLIFTLVQPSAGVSVQVIGQWLTTPNLGIYAQYAFSIDGGITYSSYSDFLELVPGVPSSGATQNVLVGNGAATHLSVQVINRDQATALTNVTVTATQFANTGVNTTPTLGSIQRSTAGGPAAGQAAKNYNGFVTLTAGTQTIPIETVTLGKSYLITDIIITTDDSASGALLVTISAAGTVLFQSHINSTKGIEVPGIETQPTATAGQAVALNIPIGTVGKHIAWNIMGVEQ